MTTISMAVEIDENDPQIISDNLIFTLKIYSLNRSLYFN